MGVGGGLGVGRDFMAAGREQRLVPDWRLYFPGTLTPGPEGGNSPAEGWGASMVGKAGEDIYSS